MTVFIQQAISEALWRPTVPLIVALRVKEPNLRSVWLALRVLTAVVPHAADDGFTARDMVELAGVTDSHIYSYLATLVERGVVCKISEKDSPFPYPKKVGRDGKPKSVRYGLDLAGLERLSIDAYPDLVARYAKRYPKSERTSGDATMQQPMFCNDTPSDSEIWNLPHAPIGGMPQTEQSVHAPIGGMEMPPIGACETHHAPIGGMPQTEQSVHAPIGGMHLPLLGACETHHAPIGGMQYPENAPHAPIGGMEATKNTTHAPIGGMSMPLLGVVAGENTQKRSVLEEEERREREEDRAHARKQVDDTSSDQRDPRSAPSPDLFTRHPRWRPGASLPGHPIELWQQCAGEAARPIDEATLTDLAGQVDHNTDGFGWYWVGRAILAASLLDKGKLPYIRSMIMRWRAEDSYGSDAEKQPRRGDSGSGRADRPTRGDGGGDRARKTTTYDDSSWGSPAPATSGGRR